MITPRRGRLIAAFALMVLACLPAGPASAHSALIGSTPEDGATLSTAPESVALEFNEEVGDISPAMVLRDGDEQVVQQLDPQLDGRTMTGALPADLAAGDYSVAWRIVSVDGHPVQGVLTFTVEAAGDEASAAAPTPAPTPTVADTRETSAAASDSGSGPSIPLVVVLVAVPVAALIGLVLHRRRATPTDA